MWKVSAVLPLMSNSLPNHSVRTRTIRCRPSCFYIFVLLCMFETLDLQTRLVRVTRPCRMILLSGYMASPGQVFLIERGEKVQLFVYISWGRIIALVGLGLFDIVLQVVLSIMRSKQHIFFDQLVAYWLVAKNRCIFFIILVSDV